MKMGLQFMKINRCQGVPTTGSAHSGSFQAGSLFHSGGADARGVTEAWTAEGDRVVGVDIEDTFETTDAC